MGLCKETALNSAIFERDWTMASVQVDCNKWEGTITMKTTGKSVFEEAAAEEAAEEAAAAL